MIKPLLLSILIPASLALAQVTSNSVTVTATRSGNLQPDQVVFSIAVDSGLDVSRDQILVAVQGIGLTADNFAGVSTVQQPQRANQPAGLMFEWGFSLAVPLANLKSTVALLSANQQSIGKNNSGLSLSFSIAGTQVSSQAAQSQSCSMADLLSDARSQGQKMASAADKSLGAVLAISGSVTTTPGTSPFAVAASTPGCSLTVKFALGAL